MKMPLFLLLLHLFLSNFSVGENEFGNYILVFGCSPSDDERLFRVEELTYEGSKVIITCQGTKRWDFDYEKKRYPSKIREFPRFGPQRYTHFFHGIGTNDDDGSDGILLLWKQLYSELTLTQFIIEYFKYVATSVTKYDHVTFSILLEDYWRSQWNQDQFVLHPSSDKNVIINSLLKYHQLPTHLQKEINPHPSIHQFSALFYSPISGWGGHRCLGEFEFEWYDQVRELTKTFNAYDRLFCDVFNYHNLSSFQVDWNFPEHVYNREFLLRDDLTSNFPPDPNAVFFGSTGITFLMLQGKRVTWGNILRPFDESMWFGSGITLAILSLIGLLFHKACRNIFGGGEETEDSNNMFKDSKGLPVSYSSERMYLASFRIFIFLLTSAYSGMILVGFLTPRYQWSPKTFKQLNYSGEEYYAGLPKQAGVSKHLLVSKYVLNLMKDRIVTGTDKIPDLVVPAAFLHLDHEDVNHRYAILVYSDKKSLYVAGKEIIYYTKDFIYNVEQDNEVVLQEMRYVSAAPAATKLHFLIESIRRIFECGVWMRWKKLEENYFQGVVYLSAMKYNATYPENRGRSFNFSDITTTLCIWTCGIGGTLVAFIVTTCWNKIVGRKGK